MLVAPFTGAWIETVQLRCVKLSPVSHPLRVRGLKRRMVYEKPSKAYVAPFTGAWIETYNNNRRYKVREVAPFTGAWIETENPSI